MFKICKAVYPAKEYIDVIRPDIQITGLEETAGDMMGSTHSYPRETVVAQRVFCFKKIYGFGFNQVHSQNGVNLGVVMLLLSLH